jgi:hypothetical protein
VREGHTLIPLAPFLTHPCLTESLHAPYAPIPPASVCSACTQVLFTYHEGLRADELLIYYGEQVALPYCWLMH